MAQSRNKTASAAAAQQKLKRLLAACAAFRTQYGRRAGVISVAHGVKQKKGKHLGLARGSGVWAIIVYVKKKLPKVSLEATRRGLFPESFHGFPTDVVEVSDESAGVLAVNPGAVANPLVGGTEIGLEVNGVITQTGTGCIVGKVGSQPRLLTCVHVLKQYDHVAGEFIDDPTAQIVQPGIAGNSIGAVGKCEELLDSGFVNLRRPFSFQQILGTAGIVNVNAFWNGSTHLPPGLEASKFGATSPFAAIGKVTDEKYPSKFFDPVGNLGPLIRIKATSGTFAKKGDSGAPVIADLGAGDVLLGMIVGIEAVGSPISYAMPIYLIAQSLGFSPN